MRTVIFACIHNAGRSQMAAAWMRHLRPDDSGSGEQVRVISAGTEPGVRVHPEVLVAMREVGINLAGITPQRLTDAMLAEATDLITMGCGDVCMQLPTGLQCVDWPLLDPKGQSVAAVREIRDDIRARVVALLEGWRSSSGTANA